VRALARDEVEEIVDLLEGLASDLNYPGGGCWCEVGRDNPMMRGIHSDQCLEARRVHGHLLRRLGAHNTRATDPKEGA
jgi:hypothetical protein